MKIKTGKEIEHHDNLKDMLNVRKLIKELPLMYWLILIVQAVFTTSLYTFTSYATSFIKQRWGYTNSDAALFAGMVSLTNMVTSPIIGLLVGRYGHRVYLILLGSVIMLLTHVGFGFLHIHPAVFTSSLGLVQSIMDSCLLPSVSFVVPEHIYGRAYQLVVFTYNIGLFIAPIVVGAILDKTGSIITANFVFIGLSSVGAISSITMFYVNRIKLGNLLNQSGNE